MIIGENHNMGFREDRTKMLSECSLPLTEQQVMAQIIFSVIKFPDDSMETVDWQIARELINKGFRRRSLKREVI